MANSYTLCSNYHMYIRLFSWWHSAEMPKRTFVIAALRYDWEEGKEPFYTTVGLLEYGYDDAIYMTYEKFKQNMDEGRIIPMNTTPNMPVIKDDKKTNP